MPDGNSSARRTPTRLLSFSLLGSGGLAFELSTFEEKWSTLTTARTEGSRTLAPIRSARLAAQLKDQRGVARAQRGIPAR